jgi:hypothetical protein
LLAAAPAGVKGNSDNLNVSLLRGLEVSGDYLRIDAPDSRIADSLVAAASARP